MPSVLIPGNEALASAFRRMGLLGSVVNEADDGRLSETQDQGAEFVDQLVLLAGVVVG